MDPIRILPTEDDNAIINKILAGDKRQFEPLMRRHNPSLFRLGMSMLNNDADVEDVMQTTYINAYQHLASFRQEAAFSTWIKRIMINECNQHLKKRKRLVNEDISVLADHHPAGVAAIRENPVAKVIDKELGTALEKALLHVPEKYRLVFVMREIEQLSNAEISKVLNISPVNAKVRLLRAKLILRGKISEYYKNDLVFSFHLVRCDRIIFKVLDELGIPH
ncbi:MAG: sigma-70 family RNA polymerase sigma factor [Chitinophaga sp.]|uniref:sigma-70 family RNA polymerase sigma factor n=1 Tax=Chitinophaga sp. TaxID=1869181 RepID=UPI001B29E909|nr:sigma-70 family RNA polymerase sigma factor [Chitinophaga sp.]MBO9731346.1 sigma-70 family RNA polymerase sigma factor [Chitinophaga sp.]